MHLGPGVPRRAARCQTTTFFFFFAASTSNVLWLMLDADDVKLLFVPWPRDQWPQTIKQGLIRRTVALSQMRAGMPFAPLLSATRSDEPTWLTHNMHYQLT